MQRSKRSNFNKSNLKKRDENNIPVKKLVIISCEGLETEPNYLKSIVNKLIKSEKIASGSVVIAPHQHTNPKGVLDDLLNYSTDYTLFDKKWIVIDRDEIRTISSNSSGHPEEDFKTAIKEAESRGVKVAWSNPCFEIFIIEHYMYRDTGGDRKDIQDTALKLLCKDNILKEDSTVDELKSMDNLYDILQPKKGTGIKNIKKLMDMQKDLEPVKCNPGTKFHELVEELEELGK